MLKAVDAAEQVTVATRSGPEKQPGIRCSSGEKSERSHSQVRVLPAVDERQIPRKEKRRCSAILMFWL